MLHSVPDSVRQIFADAKQPGYQGVLEVISFLVVSATLIGALVGSVILLFAT
jgi:hypothetical protein